MIRVVDVMPDKDQIAACGLTKKDFTVDRDVYRHFVEQYRREYVDFKNKFNEKEGAADPDRAGAAITLSDKACMEAFERSRPPFCYHRGSIYRYKIDFSGTEDRPITLERAALGEISGSVAGIPISSVHAGLLTRFCLWVERKLQEREQ